MSLVDRLRGRQPESELEPLAPQDFDDLIATARARGVKDFITVLALQEPVTDHPDQTEPYTRFGFNTKSGRKVEYDEKYGAKPDTRETALSGATTSQQRLTALQEAGLPAHLIDGYGNDGPRIIVDPYDSVYVKVWDLRDTNAAIAFTPHIVLTES